MPREEYYAERLYKEDNFPFSWLLRKFLSKVKLSDDHARALRELSDRGIVVYALKQKSQLDSLIIRGLSAKTGIPRPVYSQGVNMVVWQPFPVALRSLTTTLLRPLFKKVFPTPNESGYLKRITQQGSSSIIHLGGSEFFEDKDSEDGIRQLIEAQRTIDVPVYIVPQLVTYGRRRDRERESMINILFGQTDNTGPLRRVITFFRYSRKVSVIPAGAVNLAEFIKEKEAGRQDLDTEAVDAGIHHELRRELIDRIDEEKASIVGPVLKSKDEFISMVLNDRKLVAFMENIAAQRKTSYQAVLKDARRCLREIASDYNEMFIEIWDVVLTWLWNNIYDGVAADQEGLAKIRDHSRRMPFVIIPCHRSHIDYFLLSYVFYKHNIQMPFIAAGANLLFWPVGYLFRKSGAFFLRRTIRGNALYGEVIAKYVEVLLKEGLPIEFFIEGGRSRTGKMIMPKYGLLAMIIQAYLEKACEDLAVVPVYIGYDKVIEEKSYLKELGGIPKAEEKTSDVLKIGKLLRKRYGRVYVNIGDPILLKSYLAAQEKPIEEMNVEERQSLYRKIGYEIVLSISKVSVVTPFSLVASGLLCHNRRGISHDDLMDALDVLYEYLAHRKVSFAATFTNREKAVEDALNLFEQSEIIAKMGAGDEEEDIREIVYSLDDDKRLNLEYYKNNILHYFLPASFVALSLLASMEGMVPLSQIVEDYRFFKRLFWHEFIFDEKTDDGDEVNDVLSYLYAQGMITGEERDGQAWIEVRGKGRVNLLPFAGLIHNYLESYWVVVRGCTYLKKEARQEKDWLRHLHKLGTMMYKKGEITRSEALSQSNYQSAMDYFKDAGILLEAEVAEKGDKKEKKVIAAYSLTGNRSQMEALRRRLFKFL